MRLISSTLCVRASWRASKASSRSSTVISFSSVWPPFSSGSAAVDGHAAFCERHSELRPSSRHPAAGLCCCRPWCIPIHKEHFAPGVVLFYFFAFLAAAFFFGRPIGSTPTATSQFGCLHFGQFFGLPSARLTHSWPQRRHSQIISSGIAIFFLYVHIITFFSLDVSIYS